MEPDLRGFPQKLEGGLQGAVGTAGKVGRFIGLSLGAATIAATGKQIIQIGNDFTTSLNTMQAVSSATADQMAQVSERAKQLGNDISLPNTSASDAAAAMTELAKGGFSVEQSMAAAKGTLQLAAAAQIDAATAATIQSQALQAFGLNADYAATAADVLANTANASSAEMTDVAYGLQQAGTVANQFGVSMEDTSTAIGLFANAGITGSDAGTLLKSALLALTDQGKPAQAAIFDLGLTVYDAQGKFVGLRSLFEQLEVASKDMTEEQYQAATATLFGSDAMRLAGVAAEQGVVGYDKMRDAIGRQGAAADVAAAKTQGLPGALSAAQNAAETLALEVYDLADGPLESLANGFASFVSDATPAVVGGLSAIGGAVADIGSFFLGLPGPAQAATAALVAMKVTGLGGLIGDLQGRGSSALAGFNDQLRLQQQLAQMSGQDIGRVSAALSVLEARVPVLGRMGEAYRSVYTPAASFASQQVALASASGPLTGSLRAATGEAVRFGGAIGGTAMAGLSGMRSAIGGVTAALGGPWAIALGGAVALTTQLISAGQRAGQVMDTYRRSIDDTAKANDSLRQALVDSNGLVNDQVQGAVTSKIDALRASSQQMADSAPGIWGQYSAAFRDAFDVMDGSLDGGAISAANTAQAMSDSGGRIVAAMDKTGLSSTELGKIITGDSSKFLDFTQSLLRTGGASTDLARALMDQRDAFLEARSSAGQVKDAIEQIETKAVGAAGGVDSLTNAMGRLREDGRTAENAQKALTLALDGFRSSAQNGGLAAVNAAGEIDRSTTAGVRLDDQMLKVASAWDQAGAAARTSAAEQNLSAQETEAAAAAAQEEVRNQFIATAMQAGYTKEEAEGLAAVFRTWPPKAETEIVLHDQHAREVMQRFIDENQGKQVQVQLIGTIMNGNNVTAPSDLAGLMTGAQRRANGGPITGGIPGKDSVPILGMPGEHMLDTTDVDALGGQGGVYRFRAALKAGQVGKFAVGGAVGQSASQRAHEFLAAQNGMEYGYAQVGSPSWDCSSYSSAGYAILTGRDPYTRWYTTESDFLSLGFLPGLGPRSALNLGVHNGGGGPNSHMASALGGIPFESSSSGVRYGSGAASPSDPQFENHWHLPASRFSPPEDDSAAAVAYGTGQSTKKKATWTEKNDLELDSARIAVQQAIEARDRTNSNEKKSQADRDQAANKVAQAEQRVKDLEAKKAAAESGADAGPAPAAPALESNLTDDEIRLRELQRAINKADIDRNEVYDDPERIDEREDADLALQRAINALAAEQKRQAEELKKSRTPGASASGGEAMSLSQMLGDVASEFVTSNVSDLFSVLGVNDSGLGRLVGLGVGIADWAQDPRGEKSGVGPATAPFFSKAEIDSQAPAVPGTPEWATAMANLMAFPNLLKEIPTVLRDTGGPLPHGVAGLNLSGETEWVLTGDQRRQYEADRRDLAALRAERSSAGGLARADIPHLAQQLSEAIGRPIAVNNYAPGGDGVERTLVKVEQRRVGRVRLGGR
ncbi:phage tail tape measure protein [Rhodococcus sp. NPDC003348]